MPVFPGLARRRLAFASIVIVLSQLAAAGAPNPTLTEKQRAGRALGRQPLTFEKNLGQFSADIDFLSRGPLYSAALSARGLRLRLKGSQRDMVEMRFLDSSAEAQPQVDSVRRRSTSYFLGSDASSWVRGAPHFGEVLYRDLYPGVTVRYYEKDAAIEYDLLFDVGVGVEVARIQWSGVEDVALTETGELALCVGSARLLQSLPRAFEATPAGEREIPARYLLLSDDSIGFEVQREDPSLPLRIDPRIGLASYYGGSADEVIRSVALDDEGGLWVAGDTNSNDFPIPRSAFPERRQGIDAFVARLEKSADEAGERVWEVVTTIFIGGTGNDRAVSISVDPEGRLIAVGDTNSQDFPISNDAVQRSLAGGSDLFLTVLQETDFPFFQPLGEAGGSEQGFPTNYEIAYSSLHGGSDDDFASDGFLGSVLEEGAPSCSVLVGLSDSADYPTTAFAVQENLAGNIDAVVTFYCENSSSASSYSPVFGSFLGGLRPELEASAAVARNGSFCMALKTPSTNLPAPGFQSAPIAGNDTYVGCWTPTRRRPGLPFLYSRIGATYLGGSGNETLAGVRLIYSENDPDVFYPTLAMTSSSEDISSREGLPDPPETAERSKPGLRSIVVAAFDSGLAELQTMFWFGGGNVEEALAMDSRGPCLAIAG